MSFRNMKYVQAMSHLVLLTSADGKLVTIPPERHNIRIDELARNSLLNEQYDALAKRVLAYRRCLQRS